MDDSIVVIGAGVAGLACARTLADAGRPVRLLERGRGVGGRCATRRIESQAVDHGPAFLHGSDPRFLRAALGAGGSISQAWPARVRGIGAPCHPSSFKQGEAHITYEAGVNAFPKALAAGLRIQHDTAVEKLRREGDSFELVLASGARETAGKVVLAAALEQTVALLKPLSNSVKPLRGTLSLLESMGSLPSIAVLAGYPRGSADVPFDLWYPEDSKVLQLISNDSSKRTSNRTSPKFDALVLQARPRWSRAQLNSGELIYCREMLDEAARLLGPWAANPAWLQAHRWTYARTQAGTELTAPILHRFGEGFLGLAGDSFSLGGGVEGAFLSGVQLAERILKA